MCVDRHEWMCELCEWARCVKTNSLFRLVRSLGPSEFIHTRIQSCPIRPSCTSLNKLDLLHANYFLWMSLKSDNKESMVRCYLIDMQGFSTNSLPYIYTLYNIQQSSDLINRWCWDLVFKIPSWSQYELLKILFQWFWSLMLRFVINIAFNRFFIQTWNLLLSLCQGYWVAGTLFL